LNIDATFVRSAARQDDFPRDGLAEIALVGRSNVGKSSLINALVRQKVARTSAAPGKTRLANVYRIRRGRTAAVYLVDLPGYGYAPGDTAGFDTVARACFGRVAGSDGHTARPAEIAALLVVDARHPGLRSDLDAWRWLGETVERRVIAANKIDKLARGERIRALGTLESVFQHPVTPVSAETGEGLDELWKLIDRLANSSNPRAELRAPNRSPKATAPPPRRR
jgi:GTP-binding protein